MCAPNHTLSERRKSWMLVYLDGPCWSDLGPGWYFPTPDTEASEDNERLAAAEEGGRSRRQRSQVSYKEPAIGKKLRQVRIVS